MRLLTSQWAHTRPSINRFLRSLTDLSGSYPRVDIQVTTSSNLTLFSMHPLCQVRLFTVPAFTPDQNKIPFARVNHNKYMVTDKQVRSR